MNVPPGANGALKAQMPRPKRAYVKKSKLGLLPKEIEEITRQILLTLQTKGRLTLPELTTALGRPRKQVKPVLDVLISTPLVNEVRRSGDAIREDRSYMYRYGNLLPEPVNLATIYQDIKVHQEELNMCTRRTQLIKRALEEAKSLDGPNVESERRKKIPKLLKSLQEAQPSFFQKDPLYQQVVTKLKGAKEDCSTMKATSETVKPETTPKEDVESKKLIVQKEEQDATKSKN